MEPDSELLPPEQSKALARREANAVMSPAQMMQSMIDKGVTGENVAAFKELAELSWKFEARSAEKEFAQAFANLQAELKSVKATQAIPNNDGTVRSTFAPYEEIMKQVRPLLEKHGFTITFSTTYDQTRVIKTCVLQHIGGHSKTNQFAARIGQGPPKSSEAQADGAAATFAKRGALCDALNIVIEHDTDARAIGDSLSPEQADEIERRVKETNTDVKAFLKFAGGAATFAEIPAVMYNSLDHFLRQKEKGR